MATINTRKRIFLTVILLLLAFTSAESKAAAPAPLNMSVVIYDEQGLWNAPSIVDFAAQHGHRRVNFVITVKSQLDNNLLVQNYGLSVSNTPYKPFDESLRTQFQRELRDAFAKAAADDMEIAILLHVDASDSRLGWRNYFDMDPLQAYGGNSYQRVVIDTVVNALEESTHSGTKITMELAGEMGRSVFAYPESYRAIIAELRQRSSLQHLKLGINLNWGGVSGHYEPSPSQRASLQRLIEESDFLGISLYGNVSLPPKVEDFTVTLNNFVAELQQNGIALPHGFPLHFSEVGHGGGNLWGGIARDPSEATNSAWAGTSDHTNNPWSIDSMRVFRHDYYHALLLFLRTQPAAWPVTAAYLWDESSWDPYGVNDQVFADQDIIEMIRQHNAEIGTNLP
jgi:hypothetical protein